MCTSCTTWCNPPLPIGAREYIFSHRQSGVRQASSRITPHVAFVSAVRWWIVHNVMHMLRYTCYILRKELKFLREIFPHIPLSHIGIDLWNNSTVLFHLDNILCVLVEQSEMRGLTAKYLFRCVRNWAWRTFVLALPVLVRDFLCCSLPISFEW